MVLPRSAGVCSSRIFSARPAGTSTGYSPSKQARHKVFFCKPVDATKPTVVTIDWADGIGAIQGFTIPAGQNTTTFTHTYKDDDPTLTPDFPLSMRA